MGLKIVKVKFSKVNPKKTDTWDFEVNNQLEGKYTSIRENVGPNFSRLYYVETDNGEFAFWGSTLLDALMKSVPIGSFVRVLYKGTVRSEKSKRSYKDFEVEMGEEE